jgi:ornithine cyclodeaminase
MFIDSQQILDVLPMKECIQVMRKLFLLDMNTEVVNPLRSKMLLQNETNGVLGMMPAYIKPYNCMGIKVLSVFPNNYKKGLSSHQGILHLFETDTGTLIASLDADEITAIRTAAVSALVTDKLAIKNAEILCLIGSGKQAEKHLEAILCVRNIKNVTVWSKNKENALKFLEKVETQYDVAFKICNTVEEAAINADIICTVTASKEPVIKNHYLKQHVHINAVGACTTNARELASEIITSSYVFVDHKIAATNEAGDILIPALESGLDAHQLITSDISELLKNITLKKSSNKTVFKSVGIAAEDIAAGLYCYNKIKNN